MFWNINVKEKKEKIQCDRGILNGNKSFKMEAFALLYLTILPAFDLNFTIEFSFAFGKIRPGSLLRKTTTTTTTTKIVFERIISEINSAFYH